MDIKNSPARYAQTAGVPGLDLGPIRASVAWLLEDRVDYEFRTTAVRQFHDSDSPGHRDLDSGGTPVLHSELRGPGYGGLRRPVRLFPGRLEGFAGLVRPFVACVELRGS